ncbi:MAG: hypothetical protein WCG75_02590 [Armatimonadota bacterium]
MASIGRFFNIGVFSTELRKELQFEIALSETGWTVVNGGSLETCGTGGPESLYKEASNHRILLSPPARDALSILHGEQQTYSDRAFQQRHNAIAQMVSEVERAC